MAQRDLQSMDTLQACAPDIGRKITFDNLDYRQEVHHMTEDHQNIDRHYVTVMSTNNRVHGHHLSDKPPETGIFQMENGKCLPSVLDNVRQRENYITLVERVIANSIPCLHFLSDVVTIQIPHQYSKEMKTVSDTVSTNNAICSIVPSPTPQSPSSKYFNVIIIEGVHGKKALSDF